MTRLRHSGLLLLWWVILVSLVMVSSTAQLLGAAKGPVLAQSAGGGVMPFGVEVGSFTKPVTTTGTQDITISTNLAAAAAGTWAILFFTGGSTAATDTWGTWGFERSVGFVANGGGTISQYAIGGLSQDNQSPAITARRTATKCITMSDSAGSGTWFEADFVSFPSSTSMRLDWTTNDADAIKINYVIISGLTNAKVIKTVLGGSTGNTSITGFGSSTPDLVFHATAMTASGNTSDPHAYFAFGALNSAGEQWSNSVFSTDNVTADTARWQRTDSCLVLTTQSAGQQARATYTSMDVGGYTMNLVTNAVGATWELISLCMDGVQSKLGSFTNNASGTQTVTPNQGFTPKAIVLTGVSANTSSTPGGNGLHAMGASTVTSEVAIAEADTNGSSPSDAGAVWSSTKAFLNPASGNTTQSSVDVTALAVNSFDLSVGTAMGSDEVLYALLG